MEGKIKPYDDILRQVLVFYKSLRLDKFEKRIDNKGRKLAISIPDIISLALLKQKMNIATKKAVYEMLEPPCSYKTMTVNMNRFASLAVLILAMILKTNRNCQHIGKWTDSTDIPVCLNKNARHNKTMKCLSAWGHSGKGYYFGLKLHLTADFNRKILAIKFTPANVSDKSAFADLNKDFKNSVFVADAGYVSAELSKKFYRDNNSILIAKPRKNMKKIASIFENLLYDTRMQVEINFRNLKLFHGLITSLPRSVNGYLANYIYSLLAYLINKNSSFLKDQFLCFS